MQKLRRVLSGSTGIAGEVPLSVADGGIEYVNFYLSPDNIRLGDIDED